MALRQRSEAPGRCSDLSDMDLLVDLCRGSQRGARRGQLAVEREAVCSHVHEHPFTLDWPFPVPPSRLLLQPPLAEVKP